MNSLHNVIQQHLTDHNLSNLRSWLAQNQWEAQGRLLEFVDQVDEALIYFDDGYIDEMGLHKWLIIIWADYSSATVFSHWQEEAEERAAVPQNMRNHSYQPTQWSLSNSHSTLIALTA